MEWLSWITNWGKGIIRMKECSKMAVIDGMVTVLLLYEWACEGQLQ